MTIDTSREAVERLLTNVTPGPWAASEHQWPDQVGCCPLVGRPFSAHKNMLNVAAANTKADIHFIAAARELVPALLAERDAALAEVARLSTPPDDAEMAELVAELGEPLVIIEGYSADYVDTDDVRERMGKAADALTRLSHAHVAEKDKREGMEHALYALTKACEGEPSEVFAGEIGGALTHAHATLAAHAARREE